VTSLDQTSLESSAYALSNEDVDDLVQFAADCSRLVGSALESISLQGEADAPKVVVLFRDERQRPGVAYSYEWRLRDLDDPDDAEIYPLGVMLVDHLGNHILEDLQTTPGLPMWEPDSDGVIHVDVQSERYRSWPEEWRALGQP
jgi:hypothetical protein